MLGLTDPLTARYNPGFRSAKDVQLSRASAKNRLPLEDPSAGKSSSEFRSKR